MKLRSKPAKKIKPRLAIVGLDLSLTSTGIVILNQDSDLLCDVLSKTNSKQTDFNRQQRILIDVQTSITKSTQMSDVVIVFFGGLSFWPCFGQNLY